MLQCLGRFETIKSQADQPRISKGLGTVHKSSGIKVYKGWRDGGRDRVKEQKLGSYTAEDKLAGR